MINRMYNAKVWDEITYPFLNFNSSTVDFIPHFIMNVIS